MIYIPVACKVNVYNVDSGAYLQENKTSGDPFFLLDLVFK